MNTEHTTDLHDCIDRAAATVGSVWPIHSFVTANPLSGFEDKPFHEAVDHAEALFGGRGYPSAEVFGRAYEAGRIDPAVLEAELAAHGYDDDPAALLEQLAQESVPADGADSAETATDRVDHLLTKWLAAFLEEGTAEWPMPNREEGFYAAFGEVARYDNELPEPEAVASLPDEPEAAIEAALADYPPHEWESIAESQFAALPGWTGFLKQRAADDGDWQSASPITLAGYLAVRLALVEQFDAPIEPSTAAGESTDDEEVPLAELWLRAWEASYRGELVEAVASEGESLSETRSSTRPDAQLVFCIDTRSEVLRRHIESTGEYETHGYAGFFGVPMRYEGYGTDVSVDACPPILDAQHRIAERPARGCEAKHEQHDHWHDTMGAGRKALKALKSNAATAFSFVESAGAGYGAALAARTLVPDRLADAIDAVDDAPETHEFCEPSVGYNPDSVHALREGLTLDEQVEYAATAFELMGWKTFARLVVFTGHASQTSNNPFDSSLDCGACAGNPGGPNARVLAAICNRDDVKARLRERGIDIPKDTVFVAGEHNTTTDEVTLYAGDVPESHHDDIEALRGDLETAREATATERAGSLGVDGDGAVGETKRRAVDWAQTRPEWGLAGNAGFVIGPSGLTADLDLDGRSFLHSYDWTTDPDGEALEAIMTGPMVVTQWINNQYYFATVDNGVYGSGSKITHNPVGNVGVYQGNGGDLMTGLPLQSVMNADDEPHHQPLRLSTVIHAPVEQVAEVVSTHQQVAELLDNGWLSLTVVDPTQGHAAFEYDGEGTWSSDEQSVTAEPTTARPVADD